MFPTALKPEKANEIFGALSADKRRLPSSGLVKLGVPYYVGEWVLDELIPGMGTMTESELRELQMFIDEMLPRKNEQGIYKHRLLSGDTVQLLTYMSVEIDITRSQRTREAKIPALGFQDCWIPDELVER